MISVRRIDDQTFEATVSGRTETLHRVTVTADYCRKLTGGRMTAERLVEKSFEFLLERESNKSILRNFDLSLIGRYFPEYEEVIRKTFASQNST